MKHFEQFPKLSQVKQLAFDCETCDPRLLVNGPGAIRDDGYVIGISLAWRETERSPIFGLDPGIKSLYFPIRHASGNLEYSKVLDYLENVLGCGIPVVAANISYDLDWLKREGITVTGKKQCVQIAESLLNENLKSYSLDSIAHSRLGQGKFNKAMYEAVVAELGCTPKEVMGNLWRMPAEEIEEYARIDAELTLQIWEQQEPELKESGLMDVWNLECRLVEVLQDMRWKGIPLCVAATEMLKQELSDEEAAHIATILRIVGEDVNPWSQDEVQAAVTKLGLKGLIIEGGKKQSFPASFLAKQNHPFFHHLLILRQLSKAGGAFLNNFLEMQYQGKLHPHIHQNRTVTGRLSASKPNMQQIPARNEELAPRIRSLFFPEPGHQLVEFDYSQVEFRIAVHYAYTLGLPGSEAAVIQYTEDASTDYHQWVSNITGLGRFEAKTLNLALSYGASKNKMAELIGLTVDEITPMWKIYHAKLPFIRALSKACTAVAESRGYIKTILGRRRRFNLYGPVKFQTGVVPLPIEEAKCKWGHNVVRYFTYRATNSLIQGSAAELVKKALVNLRDAGYIPHLTIHDSVLLSVPEGLNRDRIIKAVSDIMTHAIKFSVPLKVDVTVGAHWGAMRKH